MTTISVSNAADLSSALTLAHAGDVISLSAGAYGDVSISGKSFASDVTITSADPAHAAVVSSLSINNSSGIHLNDVDVHFTPTAATMSWNAAVTINGSHGITITGGVMTGGPAVNGAAQTATAQDASGNIQGLPAGYAVSIANSSGVTVSGTDISQFDRGVILHKAETVTIQNNDIHDLRRTAIAGDGGNLTIEGNNLHDAHPWRWGDTADGGDHADFIALWTDASRTTPESNIVVKDNVMTQGAGAPVLGMWLQGQTAGFTDVTISGNAIDIGNNQGIALSNVANGSVTGNTLVQPTGATQSPTVILQSGAKNIDVSGNLTSSVLDENSGATGNTIHDNTVVQATNATATGYYTSALLNKIAGLSADQIFSTVQQGVTFVADTTPAGPAVTAQSLLHVTGGTAGSAVIGHYTDDNLVGAAGNDTFNGNGGADTLSGGAGNDTYYVPNSTAKIVEQAGGGTDLVVAKGDHTLEANVENLQIDATNGWAATGNALNNVIVGNAGNNRIDGGDGNDTLDGGGGNDQILGGNGNDILLGGGGTDTLTGGNGADTFVIAQGFGTDKVTDFSQAQGDHILAVGAYTTAQVGADTVVTLATGDHITLTGVSMASLHAGWISEVDSLFGSAPVASVGQAGQTLAAAAPIVAATPIAAAVVAPVVAAPAAASAAVGVSIMGHYYDDTLTGTAGNDTINGDNGVDHLIGGAGDDTYIVPNGLTTVYEQPNGGTDTIIAKGDHTLEANVENLQMDGINGWFGTGNELNNVITGNVGNNKLSGMAGNDTIDGGAGNDQVLGGDGNDVLIGGAGNDTLTGGAGADVFRFDHGGGSDVVADFSYADGDRVHVADSHYTVSQVGANTVINLGGGDTMVLQHVTLSTLHSDWIVAG